ncbi:MAG: Rrf2 family transcriptional regulator [Paludibacteraceae bacterium]|nr:Rrf2 family transcriptional regulator [Paludibacteraceae bacterium]
MSKIVNLTEAASIGLHSVILIAKAKGSLNVLQLAELISSSKHHVAKILQRLVKENYLISQRGPFGGFELKRDPADITLLNIYEAIEGKIEISECPVGKLVCPFEKCFINCVTNKMTEEFVNYLNRKTLAMFL